MISSTFALLIAGITYLVDLLFKTSIDPTESDGWVAAVLFLRLIRVSGRPGVWGPIGAALLLTAAWRGATWMRWRLALRKP